MEEQTSRRLTVAEYLALEALSPDRLEYRDGFAVALAAPNKNHGRIAGNLVGSLERIVRSRGCDYFAGDAKVVTQSGDRLIPDFVVTCDERDIANGDEVGEAIIRHPWLVIEILSPSTASDDTTYKLDAYQSVPELTHYAVIDSRRRAIRVYERDADGAFTTRGPIERLILPGLADRGLSIDDVYRDTTVPRLSEMRQTGL